MISAGLANSEGCSVPTPCRRNQRCVLLSRKKTSSCRNRTIPSDPNAQASYDALSQKVITNLTPQSGTQSVADIEADLANAQTTVKNASNLNTQTQTTLTGMLQGMEGINQNQIGEQILALQNSLSASMSVTARLAQLSLVNFLSPVTG